MIKAAIVGMSRILFNAAVIALCVAGVLGYASYRLIRSATSGRPTDPRRDAAFAVLMAAAGFVRALQIQLPKGANDVPVGSEGVRAEADEQTDAAQAAYRAGYADALADAGAVAAADAYASAAAGGREPAGSEA